MRDGFTLIEVVLVISLVAILALCTAALDAASLRRADLSEERSALVFALQTARMNALVDTDETPQVADLSSFPLSASSAQRVTFAPLSGNADYEGELVLLHKDGTASTSVSINHAGRISW